MSYARRNTLILGILLVLVSAAGLYWTRVRQVEQGKVLQKRESELRVELDNINAVIAFYDSTKLHLDHLQERWQARTQVVPVADSPAQTMEYLYAITRLPGAFVSFDLVYKGQKDEKGYSVNRYALEGIGHFENLQAFLWHLEHGRYFYTVDHLEIVYTEPDSGMYTADWERVNFSLYLRSFAAPGQAGEPLPAAQLRPEGWVANPFLPLITEHLPDNRAGLPEVEGARLKALTHATAYLVDKQGRTHVLREGDRVFLGRLYRIDIQRNRAWFVLNKGGIEERLALRVELDDKR